MISQRVTLQQGGHMTMACLSGKGHGKKYHEKLNNVSHLKWPLLMQIFPLNPQVFIALTFTLMMQFLFSFLFFNFFFAGSTGGIFFKGMGYLMTFCFIFYRFGLAAL